MLGEVEYRWQKVHIAPRVVDMINDESAGCVRRIQRSSLVISRPSMAMRMRWSASLTIWFAMQSGTCSPDRPGRIEVGGQLLGQDEVRYFVRDNGIGIRAEHLERVFLPFSRFAGGEGEGIGLSLVRRVVDRHRGRVWIESASLVRGLVVWLQLPAWREVVEKTKLSKG